MVQRTSRAAPRWLMAAAALLAIVSPGGEISSSSAGPARAGTALREAIRGRGEARAIVTLVPERRLRGAAPRRRVEEVLRGIPAREVEATHRLATVPVFAARITGRGLAALLADPRVSRVDLDGTVHGADAGSAAQIGADRLRSLGISGAGVTVAVLDSGVDYFENPDLEPVLAGEECFCSNGGGCCPDGSSRQSGFGAARSLASHGPGVMGILASQGAIAPEGIAPGSRLLAVRILDDTVTGTFSDVLTALDWVLREAPQARIVNLSLAAGPYPSPCDHADAFNEALALLSTAFRERGALLVAAAGNHAAPELLGSPACVSSVLSVGSVNSSDRVSFFGDGGEGLDLLAPGENITTSSSILRLQSFSGTSAATPHVAAAAALLLEANPDLTPADLEERLTSRGVPVTDLRTGRVTPRIDVYRALLLPMEVAVSPPVLSFRSRGKGIHLILQPRFPQTAEDLDPATILASLGGGGEVAADASSAVLGDENADGVSDLRVSVDRRGLVAGVSGTGEIPLVVRATFVSGIEARGNGSLRILSPGGIGRAEEPTP